MNLKAFQEEIKNLVFFRPEESSQLYLMERSNPRAVGRLPEQHALQLE